MSQRRFFSEFSWVLSKRIKPGVYFLLLLFAKITHRRRRALPAQRSMQVLADARRQIRGLIMQYMPEDTVIHVGLSPRGPASARGGLTPRPGLDGDPGQGFFKGLTPGGVVPPGVPPEALWVPGGRRSFGGC